MPAHESAGSNRKPGSRASITPEAFHVAPALLGLPLAPPWRRLAAIGVDALIVVVLAQSGGLFLAAAVALLFYSWVRGGRTGVGRRGLRVGVGVLGAIVVFGVAVAFIEPLLQSLADDEPAPEARAEISAQLSGSEAVRAGLVVTRLLRCDDEACRAVELQALMQALDDSELPPAERRDLLREFAAEAAADADERARLHALIDEQRPVVSGAAPPQRDDPPPAAAEDEAVANEDAAALLDESGGFSIVRTLKALAEDLGFSFGWGAVYFTLLTVLWDGQTIGKRWLGIRVIALSGKPLSYWDAFDRYGGYAAGFATGLLGFLQVYWDDNRQAIHDRISFTAVIRDADGRALARMREAGLTAAAVEN